MLLQSSLYALAVDPPRATSDTLVIAILAVLCALGAFAIWLLVSGSSGQDGLRERGVRLSMAGQYPEAEQCYRNALAADSKLKPRTRARLLVCLGDVLMDMDRYAESQQHLESALAMGDPTGSCRASLSDLLLLQGSDSENALDLANQAIEASTDGLGEITRAGGIGRHLASLVRADRWARRAWALALLGRQSESQESIDFALKLALPSCAALTGYLRSGSALTATTVSLCRTSVYQHTGMALLSMGNTSAAREHFKIACDAGLNSKTAARCRQQLGRLGMSVG